MRCRIILILILHTGIACAQKNLLQFSKLDLESGLSNNHVTAIFRDVNGFMWFGTASGLNRYDGHQVKVFKHSSSNKQSINDDFVTNIYELPRQKLLVNTRAGLNIYDIKKESFTQNIRAYLKTLAINVSVIQGVVKDKQGKFWFDTGANGVYIYNSTSNKTTHLKCGIGLDASPVSDISSDEAGNIWVIHTNKTLEKINAPSVVVKNRYHNLRHSNRADFENYRIFIDRDEEAYIYCTDLQQGITCYNTANNKTFQINKKPGGLNNDLITGIIQDKTGLIWIGTDHGGINLLNKRDSYVDYMENTEGDPKSLGQNSIVCLYKDAENIVWIGTFKKGVSYYHPNIIKFPLYHHLPYNIKSLPYDDVNRFAEAADGSLWIGTNGKGLIHFNRNTGDYKVYRHNVADAASLSNDIIVSLFVDEKQKLWIGTYFGGLDCFDGKTFKHYHHSAQNKNSLADDRVWDIIEDDEDLLWIATFSSGIDVLDQQRYAFRHYSAYVSYNTIGSNYITALLKDKKGNIWIGTSCGLDVLQKANNTFRHFSANAADKNALSNGNVYDIAEDSSGYIWVATRDGLDCFNPKTSKFKTFRTEDGLADNITLNVLQDRFKNLWISTANGLSRLQVFNSSRGLTYKFSNYDQQDGLQGKEFNVNAAFATREGELIFGGPNGFNLFRPENIRADYNKPLLTLTDLQISNKSVGIGEEMDGQVILKQAINYTSNLILNHQQNVISVEFTAIDFFNPNKIKYRYKLSGFDKKWQQTVNGVKRATYTNLNPGDYTFTVMSTNAAGQWVSNEKSIHIKLLPPIWQTTQAYLFYIIISGGGLYLMRRKGIRDLTRKFALEQERQEARRMHELDEMKIKFLTNISHEFRTPLSLIITPLDKLIVQTADKDKRLQMEMIQRNGRRLLNLVNQLLDFRRMEEHELKLQSKPGDLVKFIKDLSYSFTDIAERKHIEFVFRSDMNSLVTQFDHDKMERIIFNLLSNAFKFTPSGGNVAVELTGSVNADNNIVIKIKDSGIGIEPGKHDKIFERFYQNDIPGSMVNQGSGIGLSITKEFVKLHGGSIAVNSQPSQGSVFIITLPLRYTDSRHNCIEREIQKRELYLHIANAAQQPDKESSKKPNIVIVEDNDDFRFYLKTNLKDQFTVHESCNGKEGWQQVLAEHPHLVVTDVNMPEIDGIELCKKIKNDKRTAHIPVILLTAFTAEQTQLIGLETGANDYVMKPFNMEILTAKIKNLLSQLELFKNTYKKQVDITPSDTEIESQDAKFMRKLVGLLEKNLSNAEYTVDLLSNDMHVSRVGLYKKILALTGKSPIEFIRIFRIKKAAELLVKSQLTISQVAYEVGFNNPKYFTKYFKEEYGLLPSAYINKYKAVNN